ncbi:dihydrolipoamide acetyltransferase family protein [Leifsonia sp. NPDC080035]|uniref:Dihydrolipoamide acetyltransferase component of pyruvate dehydrogenase complex n=1 Tax=Leifsonia sp. NPDC080035 TaxID=3143936 RepID=A0AAU7GHB4_9MICO
MIDILMPRLSDTMTEGAIALWRKQPGDPVAPGDVLVEIETDKALMEQEAYDAGVLAEILVPEGENVAIGTPIARLDDGVEHPETEAVPPAPEPRAADDRRRLATPVVRRIAKERGIDLATIAGSGPGGRIVRADLPEAEAAAAPRPSAGEPRTRADASTTAPTAPAPAPAPAPSATDDVTRVPFDGIRRAIAARLTESATTVPAFTATASADVTELLALRVRLNDAARPGVKISVNDLVVKAVALTLREHPALNASYAPDGGGQTLLHGRVDVGVAVDAPSGLVVPVVRAADTSSLSAIAGQTRALAQRAADRALTADEMSGGTFTVSNLGMYGVEQFTAIINPPQGAILAVGSAHETLTLTDGEVTARRRLRYTLTCDHRIIDGAAAGRFLATLTELLQSPLALLA